MIEELPVTFVNRNGFRLFGMLYSPSATVARRVGIVVSVNAIKYRVGTFGLHVWLARELAEQGYFVLTFDPEGIGDSEGPFEYKFLSEHYHDIQTGKYTNDLGDAISFFEQQASLDKVVMFGLCGGAISTLMEAGDDNRVDGLVLLNIPVLVEDLARGGQTNNAARITSSETAATLLKHKLHRLIELRFWKRALKVNYREELKLVARSVSVLSRRVTRKSLPFLFRSSASVDAVKPVSSHQLFNMHFQTSFRKSMNLDQRLLFVFAELDPWATIFNTEFRELALKPGNPYERKYQIETIAASNHIFAGKQSSSQLSAIISRWLMTQFPVHK